MKKAFVSCHVAEKIEKELKITALELKPYSKLDNPVNTHADMLVFVLDNQIFCYSEYYEENKRTFEIAESDGYQIIKCKKECSKEYPNDISLNILLMGKTIFARLKSIAPEVLEYAKDNGYELINVNQGYSACATLVLDESNAITADKSIYNAILKAGKNATLISGEGIKLEGYNCGFIGGASFVIENEVYFLGDVKKLVDYEKIHQKIAQLSMKEKSISCLDVVDFGGVRLI